MDEIREIEHVTRTRIIARRMINIKSKEATPRGYPIGAWPEQYRRDRGVVNFRNAQEVVAADVAKRTADLPLDIETLAGIRPVLDLLVKRS